MANNRIILSVHRVENGWIVGVDPDPAMGAPKETFIATALDGCVQLIGNIIDDRLPSAGPPTQAQFDHDRRVPRKPLPDMI